MPRIMVVYDDGSATPMEIATSLGQLGEVVFALPRSAHNSRLAPLIDQLGTVVPLPDMDLEPVRSLRPDAVLTFSERRVPLTASITEALGLPGHPTEVAARLTDKSLQRARLGAIDPVRSSAIASVADWPRALAEVGLPAVIKPAVGEGSRHTYLIDSEPAGARLVDRLFRAEANRPLVVEQYLRGRDSGPYGDYVSVESMICDGQPRTVAVTGKFPLLPPFREVGNVWAAAISEREHVAVTNLADRAIKALGIRTGITHTEIKLTDGGPRVLEVNGRLGGYLAALYRDAMGFDLVRAAGELALGRRVRLPESASRPAATAGPVYFVFSNLAPRGPGALASVQGAAQVRRLPGIRDYRRLIPPAGAIEDSVSTQRLDVIRGQAGTYAAMLDTVDQVRGLLNYAFTTPLGTVRMNARELLNCVELPGRVARTARTGYPGGCAATAS